EAPRRRPRHGAERAVHGAAPALVASRRLPRGDAELARLLPSAPGDAVEDAGYGSDAADARCLPDAELLPDELPVRVPHREQLDHRGYRSQSRHHARAIGARHALPGEWRRAAREPGQGFPALRAGDDLLPRKPGPSVRVLRL